MAAKRKKQASRHGATQPEERRAAKQKLLRLTEVEIGLLAGLAEVEARPESRIVGDLIVARARRVLRTAAATTKGEK